MVIKVKIIKRRMMKKYKNNLQKLIMQTIKGFKKCKVQQ